MSDGLRELMNEQARENICGQLGHHWRIVLPVQKRDEARQVFCLCQTCRLEGWVEFPLVGYKQFLQDFADGKISQPVYV